MDCDDFTCPDGTCVDTKFDCEWQQCGNLTYCQISKMCVTKMAEFCAGCYVENPYRCNNGQCITKNAFCNNTYECSDRSDETSYECTADNDRGVKMPWWVLQVIGPVIGIGIAILITIYKRKRIARMRAEQARPAQSGTLVPGAVNTGNMPPPPPGMVMNTVCPMGSTAAPPPSYNSAMRTSKPTSTGFFGGLFTNQQQTPRSSAPPTYSAATGGAPYPTNTYPTQPANDPNYNTQYGMQGQSSAFTYS